MTGSPRAPRLQPRLQVVWFKRDLRVTDHEPLKRASAAGPVLGLCIFEPGLWAQPTMAARQWAFVGESLQSLETGLAKLGGNLVRASGDAVATLDAILGQCGPFALWSHEESGDAWTYARDRQVADWARARGICWTELPFGGVVRRLRGRDGWARHWERVMARPVLAPSGVTSPARLPDLPFDPRLAPDFCPARQTGGRGQAESLLASFLQTRGRDYRRAMSSPLTGFDACSRLSPHLAYGTLSTREATHAARSARAASKARGQRDGWVGSLDSFIARLHWRCHFMQKLEDEPAIEYRCMHRAYEGLREPDHQPARLDAWVRGETGWPMVDACVRALHATGYVNFRMRAMIASVAAYALWLDWRRYGDPLAAMFTDYEPGIHWSQLQMQAGTTGINATRVYNPIKQQRDQDPQGIFVRRWVPELARVPIEMLHQPWAMDTGTQTATGCRLDRDYPRPLDDVAAASRVAKDRIHAVRHGPAFQSRKAAIVHKHASRKRPNDRTPRPRQSTPQLSFDF